MSNLTTDTPGVEQDVLTQVCTVVTSTSDFILTAVDRCDSCEAQAYFRAELKGGFSLDFCGHHFKRNEAKLLTQSERIIDESAKLLS